MFWHCFNAQPLKNRQQIILCFGIYAKVPFKGSQSLIYWETKILCNYSVRNSRCCRAIIAIFMVSSNAKHYWISSRHPILMNCWKFYLQWAIITVIWMIEWEFWDFVTFTHCSIQIFPLYNIVAILPVIIILLLNETPFNPLTAKGRGPTILQLCDPSVNISVEDR